MNKNTQELTVTLHENQFVRAREFLQKNENLFSAEPTERQENFLVFEELFLIAVSEAEGSEAVIRLERSMGNTVCTLSFSGKRIQFDKDSLDEENVGNRILLLYREKINVSYIRGMNHISVTFQQNKIPRLLQYVMIILSALVLSALLYRFTGSYGGDVILEESFSSLLIIFGRAMSILAGPLVFTSLIVNISDAMMILDSRLELRRLLTNVIISSVGAIVIGFLTAELVSCLLSPFLEEFFFEVPFDESKLHLETPQEMILGLVPESMEELFRAQTAFPLLIASVIASVALCMLQRHAFVQMKQLFDAVNALLIQMLSLICYFLPPMLFVSVYEEVASLGLLRMLELYGLLGAVIGVGMLFVLVFYLLYVLANGVKPIRLLRSLLPAARANLMINSSIDAVPYNTRFLWRTYKIPIAFLKRELPIRAQISQVGNCFCLALVSVLILRFWTVPLTPLLYVIIGIMVLTLSVGAPGYAGSFILGMTTVFSYIGINITESISTGIALEIIFGWLITLMNTYGDLIIISIPYGERFSKKNR